LTQTFPVFSLSKHQSRSVIIPPPTHCPHHGRGSIVSSLERTHAHSARTCCSFPLHFHHFTRGWWSEKPFTILREVGGVRNLSWSNPHAVHSTRNHWTEIGNCGQSTKRCTHRPLLVRIRFFSGTLTFDDFQKYRIKRVGYQLAVLRSSLPEGPAASFNHA